ncbi:MAG: 3-methyl-2-oxobutanoate hydroxymethyltransferase [Candidatus Omnitrophica bacterium]|nr:3-methyl-2-oxobutanoate hydroxymethyltransferase [Candidatus Omnitrophota bacterium]
MDRKKIFIPDLAQMKQEGKKITMLTAYDYPLAYLVDKAGIDIILIGDSLGMVVLGYESTVPVTMDDMIHHAKAVRRGTKYAFLVGDMPFMSYNINKEEAIRNAGRFIKEAGCDSIKLEGGLEVVDTVKAIVDAGIPVMAHLGLTPQTAIKLGGFKVQGKDAKTAQGIIDSALALEKAGAFCVLMECVPDRLAELITKNLKVPTIGIGAGPSCDGQVLVTHDLLGLFERFLPKFAKQYVNLSTQIVAGIEKYRDEVRSLKFPADEHTFTIKEEELKKLK